MNDMNPIPDRIFLQWDEYDHEFGATWCADQINENDVEYVTAAEYADLQRQNELLRAVAGAAQAIMGEVRPDETEGSAYCVIHSDYLINLHGFTQAAIDGGALGEG